MNLNSSTHEQPEKSDSRQGTKAPRGRGDKEDMEQPQMDTNGHGAASPQPKKRRPPRITPTFAKATAGKQDFTD